jgi:cytidylate kinase
MRTLPFVVTISRQLGSGGAYVGRRLASRAGIIAVDREIVRRAAQELKAEEENIAARDEKKTSFWDRLLETCALGPSDVYLPPEIALVPDQELYRVESEIIRRIADECSAVIIGRGGFHVLREHPRHLSVFLHADPAFRRENVAKHYGVPGPEADRLIEKGDRERFRYLQALTGQDCCDARRYHLSIDTGVVTLDETVEIVLSVMKKRFAYAMKK